MKLTPPAEARLSISPESSRGALLEVRDLTWRPFGRTDPVLRHLHLRVEPGQRMLLAGPSGSGKSTLLRAIAGVLTATESGDFAGSVLVDGRDPQESGSAVGLMVQDPTDASVAGRVGRDVAFGLENQSVPRDRIWGRVRHALTAVRFPYGVEHPVHALSGGEAQRLALAGVLVLRPGLVLLDEPSSMLDPRSAEAVRDAIWAAAESSGATLVVVEHRLEPWLPRVDRVVVLDTYGAIAADGAAKTTLVTEGDALATQGVWVPGIASPTPLPVPPQLCTPAAGGPPAGTVVVRGSRAGMTRTLAAGLTGGGSAGTVTTLSGADAVVRAGEVVALVGASGAGKSTLALLLAGLERPSSGTVTAWRRGTVTGSKAASPEELPEEPWRWSSTQLAARVGWVPQQAELAIVGRTVREDVLTTSRMLHLDDPAPRVDGLLRVLGLAECAGIDPHHLSGGQLRRLALAGAVAHRPDLLVLDEPTVGQDRNTWAAVAGIITAARDAGTAVLVATHDPLLIGLADRRICLEHGRVIGRGAVPVSAPDELRDQEPVRLPAQGTATTVAARSPLAQRCGPLSVLASAVLLLIGALGVTTLTQGLVGVAVEFLLAPLVVGWRHRLRRLVPGLLAVASIGFSSWLLSAQQSPITGAIAGARVAFFVLPGVLLAQFIDPFALGDHLTQRLRLPGRPVVAAVAALQRFETLATEWGELRRIRRVRGLNARRGPAARVRQLVALAFALLVQTLRRASRMAVAMEARGFSLPAARRVRRTWAQPAPWVRADTALTLLSALVAAIPLALASLG